MVLDLTSNLSGPYCAMMLADHGADVIKIEQPDGGDAARNMPPFVNGESAPFMIWNRNKRSVTLDLKRDREKFLKLVDSADFVVENFRAGVMQRLKLDWQTLHARNPELILGSISGFGQTGPYRNRGGFDLITQGMSGLMSVNGPEDGPPYRLPIAISDVTAGMFLAFGMLAALEARHRTGLGQHVETSLLEAATSLCVYEAAHYFASGTRPASHRPAASRQLAVSGVRDRGRLHHHRCVAAEVLRRVCARSLGCRSWWTIRVSIVGGPGGEQQGVGGAVAGEGGRTAIAHWLEALEAAESLPDRCCISTRCSPIRRSWRVTWWWRRFIR